MSEDEDELQEVVVVVEWLVVVEDQEVQVLMLMKKLLFRIVSSKMLWARELQVEHYFVGRLRLV